MRFTSLLIIASTLLSTVFSLPVAVPKDQSLSKRSTYVGSDVIPSFSRRFEIESDELLDRDISDLFRRSKVTLSKQAHIDLDNLGLQGAERRKAINYHHTLAKAHMKTVPGARTAEISRIAHVGGSDPKEPLHATVIFRRKPTKDVKNKKDLVIERTYTNAAGVTQTGQLHHVYPIAGKPHLPTAYANAERNRATAKGYSTHSIV